MRPRNVSILERRTHTRFPLKLEVHYSIPRASATPEVGSGYTNDLSSSGLRFTGEKPLEPGQKIDLAINWPVLLDGHVQLQLIATGRIVWSRGAETAIQIDRHDFRTRSLAGGRIAKAR